MNQKINKNDLVHRISDKLSDDRIVVGGNKELYKRKYHLSYSHVIIRKVLNAFLDVLVDAIAEGNSVGLDGCIILEPKYYKERKRKAFDCEREYYITPAGYRLKLRTGVRMKEACKQLTEKMKKENVDQETV